MPPILIGCHELAKSHGPHSLFEGLSFGLFEGERTGLIGPNGAGKSTLLRILAGLETPDAGTVSVRRGIRIGYLGQRDDLLEDDPAEAERLIEEGAAWAGLPELRAPALSGGWRKRLAIVREAMKKPDLLLLDEPTNHLDLSGVLWLEGLLSRLDFSYLVVTHDRRFLERVTNRVIELNRRYPEGHFSSPGNYSDFLERREAYFAAREAREESLRNTVRGEIAWLRRKPGAQMKKGQARVDRAGELISELGELSSRNAAGRTAEIDFTAGGKESARLIELFGVDKTLGGRALFRGLDLRLGPGDKLGLLGENGSGKTTLLRLLAGESSPDAGSVRRADGLRVVTFDQERAQLDPSWTLKRALCPAGEHVEFRGKRIHVYGWAARFLFREGQLAMPLRRLSGGEQSRALIARLMLAPADLLLLDEPTNDLDVASLEVLESSMTDFPGALVLVTHDRWLLDRVSRELLALDGKGGARFYADLSQWEAAQSRTETPAAVPAAALPVRERLTEKEYRELKNMDAAIERAERDVAAARAALEDPSIASDAGELAKRHAALEEAQQRVDVLFARWAELDAKR
ncbi:MAG: ABC-F family ATP-binding cassette domain-containing protein [Elusimicrobia bacterium]|nr:ABC-F family ATP-binding cassette domain-containing protein [Elusimicrobiota bacterium]